MINTTVQSNFIKSLKLRYTAVLVLLGVIAAGGFFLLETVILSQQTAATEINIAGRQRMLSQKITFIRSQINDISSKEHKSDLLRELKASIDLMRRSHMALTLGDETWGVAPPSSKALKELYFQPFGFVDHEVLAFLHLSEEQYYNAKSGHEGGGNWKEQLNYSTEGLLQHLDAVVKQYEIESKAKIQRLQQGQVFLLFITVVVLTGAGVLVFRPTIVSLDSHLSEIKANQQRLLSERKLLDVTTENMDQALSVFDDDLTLIVVNDKFRTFLDLPEHLSQIGAKYEDIIRYNARRGDYGPGDIEEMVRERVALSQNPKTHQFERTRPDGMTLLITGNPMPNGGFVTTYKDITERKHDELKLARAQQATEKINENLNIAINSMSSSFALWDKDDNLIICNENFRQLYPSITNMIVPGVNFEDMLWASVNNGEVVDAIGQEEEWIKRRIAIHRSISNSVEYQLNNGRWVLALERRTPDGGSVGERMDITERKQAELTLQSAFQEAKQANRAKSEFLASMSHELRTPMNAVLGFAQMLRFDQTNPLSENQNDYVKNIVDAGEHLLELINEILDLATIEADKINLSISDINANEIVADCVALITPLKEKRNLTIVDDFSAKTTAVLLTDPLRMRQILVNLLSNAVKFNKEGGTVTVEGWETKDGFLHLSIIDTGVGIDEDDYANVFQVFHRLGVNPMLAQEGSGIGLSVTKLLVERLAGRVGFESEKGVGSTFWIELPLAKNQNVLIWTEELRVGIDAIDKDHQKVLAMLNKISHESVPEADLVAVIEEMIDYTDYHFQREEAIMEFCNYPGLENHRIGHQQLIAKIAQLSESWRKTGDKEMLSELRQFMKDWWMGHIAKVDSEIFEFAKGKEKEILQALKSSEPENRILH